MPRTSVNTGLERSGCILLIVGLLSLCGCLNDHGFIHGEKDTPAEVETEATSPNAPPRKEQLDDAAKRELLATVLGEKTELQAESGRKSHSNSTEQSAIAPPGPFLHPSPESQAVAVGMQEDTVSILNDESDSGTPESPSSGPSDTDSTPRETKAETATETMAKTVLQTPLSTSAPATGPGPTPFPIIGVSPEPPPILPDSSSVLSTPPLAPQPDILSSLDTQSSLDNSRNSEPSFSENGNNEASLPDLLLFPDPISGQSTVKPETVFPAPLEFRDEQTAFPPGEPDFPEFETGDESIEAPYMPDTDAAIQGQACPSSAFTVVPVLISRGGCCGKHRGSQVVPFLYIPPEMQPQVWASLGWGVPNAPVAPAPVPFVPAVSAQNASMAVAPMPVAPMLVTIRPVPRRVPTWNILVFPQPAPQVYRMPYQMPQQGFGPIPPIPVIVP